MGALETDRGEEAPIEAVTIELSPTKRSFSYPTPLLLHAAVVRSRELRRHVIKIIIMGRGW